MAELFYRFGTAAAIGLLVGLQREFAHDAEGEQTLFAGVRTFALFALTGCTGALLADELGSVWGLLVPLLAIAGLIVVSYVFTAKRGEFGMTTEVAALLTVLAGALCYYDRLVLASALGVVVTTFLSFKPELHRFTERLDRQDILALVKFGIITAVVLPVLPNEGLGPPPFDVLNPYKLWLMVVLISGLSFLGYAIIKISGSQHGIALTGFLGGLASSTAVTLTFSQRSRSHRSKTLSKYFGVAILIAWVTMFIRVLVEVAIVNRALLASLWPPMILSALAGALYCFALYRSEKRENGGEQKIDFTNPFELRPALTFGALYGVILLVSRVAQMELGNAGIYVSSIAAGATDVDAITLSMAELSQPRGGLDPATAVRATTLAVMSNTVVKSGIVFVAGSRELLRAVALGMILILATGLLSAFLL